MGEPATDCIDALLADLTVEEKAALMTGRGIWDANPVERLGIPALRVTDGPNGARGAGLVGTGTPALCIPCGSALGATWDRNLVEELGAALAAETRARACHVLLAPTVNIHRTPLGGRNFECYSEDPVLTGRTAAAFIRGVQGGGVGTTIKHFVANDSEFERNSIDSVVPDRALREVYLRPFEIAVSEAEPWGLMGSYNRVNGTFACENRWLLTEVLRDEWGFDGIVVTDWFAAKSTAAMAGSGLDLEMPGAGRFYGPALVAAVEAGEVDGALLDAAARRLLTLLERTGAFDDPLDRPEVELDEPAHRALARRASAGSMVLYRNEGVLPFDAESIATLAVIGPNAADAMLMGGGSAALVPQHATSPLEAITARLGGDRQVRYEPGAFTERTTRPVRLRQLTGADGSPGFTVEYFDGPAWEGEPRRVATGRDGRLFTTDGAPFSFRAVARLTPEETGEHALTLVQAGRARVLVDGGVLLDGFTDPPPLGEAFFGMGSVEVEAGMTLVAGETVEVVVEYSSDDSAFLHGAQVGLRPPVVDDLMDRAVEVAAEADAVVLVVGTNDDWETEGRDRESMDLPGSQPELIRRVCAANPRTVVVVNAGSVVTMDWAEEAPAVLQSWFGGQEMGDALVDVLFGDAEPGGRLPTTVPHRLEDTPAFTSYPGEAGLVHYAEGVFVGYRWYEARDIEVAYPFGHGLGYTTFSWGDVRLGEVPSAAELADGATVTATVAVANVGDRPGSEVVQCYVAHLDPVFARPPQELRGFAKVHLEPGETIDVSIELDHRAFAYWDPADPGYTDRNHRVPVAAGGGHVGHREEAGWYADPGDYEVRLGTSSADIRAVLELTLAG
ncbi:MAG: glycoside hydrolase family 3 C-terminal domain-containing protein [Acidimicrobiales bacterium]|nr:glycoside hydrolase family 3 C-terminal domain-containing protein [Acidimicrobiales bacterium]